MLVTSACSSSRITVSRSAKKRAASGAERSSATCSGVVSRMSGGFSFWRWRLWTGVSPVRVSSRTREAHLGDRRARGCARCRRRAPSAARCRACGCRARPAGSPSAARGARPASAGSRRASCRRRSARSAASSGPARAFCSSSIWCGRGVQPRAANHAAKGAGQQGGPGASGVARASAGAASVHQRVARRVRRLPVPRPLPKERERRNGSCQGADAAPSSPLSSRRPRGHEHRQGRDLVGTYGRLAATANATS